MKYNDELFALSSRAYNEMNAKTNPCIAITKQMKHVI